MEKSSCSKNNYRLKHALSKIDRFKYGGNLLYGGRTMEEDKIFSRDLIGKTIVSKNGKTYGAVADVEFETRSGELINIILKSTTANAEKLELEKDTQGALKIPFSAVIAVGDFLVVAEEDII